jgi:hypothetical protein
MFLHAVGFGIVIVAVMALAVVGFTAQFGVTTSPTRLDPELYMTHNPRHER